MSMYPYVKALHIIFVVTWFAGLFYVVRLFVYNREALDKAEPEKTILQMQFAVMMRRLWFGITWPSCILTVIFGTWLIILIGFPLWLIIKLGFIAGLLAYHLSLHVIYKKQMRGDFGYTSNQLRAWNEVATVFLFAIVMLAVVKSELGLLWGLLGLGLLTLVLVVSIRIYKSFRSETSKAE